MDAVWIIAAILVLALIIMVFWPFKISFYLTFDPKQKNEAVFGFHMLRGRIWREWRLSIADIPGGWYGIWITDNKGRRYLFTRRQKPQKRITKDTRRIVFHVYRRIRIKKLYLNAELGLFSDAAATALATGAVQALVFSFLAAFYPPRGIGLKRIEIRPRFDKACFNFQSRCIITLRIEHIISAGWNNLLNKRKRAV
ncbi:MAG: DUF2953 domain-containing protein [Bacillota bacterium]